MGEAFPSVKGTGLDGAEWQLPEDLTGDPAILFVGYKQNTQFDIDRWLVGLAMTNVSARVLEVPTIKGLVPGLIAGKIDSGMRGGIPRDLWEAVVTVYGDAPEIVEFTGNEFPNNARVLLLDESGKVIYFHDEGFSPNELKELLALLPPGSVGGLDI
jgi:hypothetical protein